MAWVVTALLLLPQPVAADAFDDAVHQGNALFAEQDSRFKQIITDQDAAWKGYIAAQNAAWQRYTAEIDAVWGKAQAKVPTKKTWVDYTADRQTRTRIDFEHGTVQVDLLLHQGEQADSPTVAERIKAQLAHTITSPAKEDAALQVAAPMQSITAQPLQIYPLANQLQLANGTMVSSANAGEYVNQAMRKQRVKLKPVHTPQGDRLMASIQVSMVPNHLQRRVAPYRKRVEQMAARLKIPASLVFGIIQTESDFNPMAHSAVPAYGLMQLVPKSGARDAYRYLFNNDRVVTAGYLYDPTRNIELGAAYLKLLQIREMRRIQDPATRMLCAIAAYNTGGGNVARAFIPGSRNIKKASAIINTMSYEQVYQKLRADLPYEETRRYVMKVRKHMKNFTKFDGVE